MTLRELMAAVFAPFEAAAPSGPPRRELHYVALAGGVLTIACQGRRSRMRIDEGDVIGTRLDAVVYAPRREMLCPMPDLASAMHRREQILLTRELMAERRAADLLPVTA